MKKNILIATGGSGGHMIPALVFFSHLKKKFNLFISSDLRGLKYIDYKKYNLVIIKTPKIFDKYILLPFKFFIILLLTIKSIYILMNKKIDIILSTGGYAPLPLCLAGILLRKKLYIYEPNQVLGKSNRFLLFFCNRIFCHTSKIKKYPANLKKKILLISPIVRKFFYKKVIKKNKKFKLMIIGGSQGAKVFDKFLDQILVRLSNKKELKIVHQTNHNNIIKLKEFYDKNKISNHVFTFDKNFINLIKECDFCITRAGASTLAELFILKIPFLAIPLPSSKDNHQYENAKFYRNRNCCWLLEEKKMNDKILYNILKDIILNKKKLDDKKKSIIELNRKISWKNQNNIIMKEFNND